VPRAPRTRVARSRAGKKLLDELKKKGEDLTRSNPRSDRLQPYKSQYMRLCKLYVDSMKEHQRAKEQMRKLQLDTVVNRAAIAYGGTKSEAELREVRAAGASRHTPLAGVCWPAAAPRAERITNGPFPHSPPPLSTRARTRPQMAQRDPSGVIREAILEEASEEAQQAYTDAQSRAKDVEMLVRCARSSCKVLEGGTSGDAATKAGPHHHHAAAATPTRQPPPLLPPRVQVAQRGGRAVPGPGGAGAAPERDAGLDRGERGGRGCVRTRAGSARMHTLRERAASGATHPRPTTVPPSPCPPQASTSGEATRTCATRSRTRRRRASATAA
jgi:hypothetical protein